METALKSAPPLQGMFRLFVFSEVIVVYKALQRSEKMIASFWFLFVSMCVGTDYLFIDEKTAISSAPSATLP